ncbi:hypothetical protein PVAP13_1NG468238 [Panicum virgatum]|uniref:Uncharacterized protein n=1 Tax=Panicum virgatum TaxID=38727 RepID=A0A8T0X8I8_PANVG|nr:hypothetical protein PVAP13_1NG468238 [Panicum virgatum]
MGITSRATLLVLRPRRGRKGGIVVGASSRLRARPSTTRRAAPGSYWCRRIVEPFGPCEHMSCKASCSKKYKGEGMCIGKPEGCQCTYFPLPWTPPPTAAAYGPAPRPGMPPPTTEADGPAPVGY